MADEALLVRAQRVWTALAGTPVSFTASAIEVVVCPQSLLSPPGWVGIVAIGDAAIATAPDGNTAEVVRHALDGLPVAAMTDPAAVRARLPITETLGPATLAYCDTANFRPSERGATQVSPADQTDLGTLLARVPAEDADESGLAEITSPAFVVRSGSDVIAAAGYRAWPSRTAHLSVLTVPTERRRGLARVVGTAAVAAALAADLLPQWRARPEASRRVARALGFSELGAQLSIHL